MCNLLTDEELDIIRPSVLPSSLPRGDDICRLTSAACWLEIIKNILNSNFKIEKLYENFVLLLW